MISYVTGQLGHGKSAFAIMRGARGLLSGRVLATNIRLLEEGDEKAPKGGWQHEVLRHAPYYRVAGRRARKEYRDEISERYFYSQDIRTLINLRLHGTGEGRGIRILDETHNALNNRDWADNHQKAQLRKMTLSRKRGWEDYIIAQHSANTDAALRRVASIEIELLNWKKVLQLPFIHTPLLPMHVFLATAYRLQLTSTSVSRVKKPMWRELHLLGWWKRIYDTFEDFDVNEVDDEPSVWLPLRGAARPALQGAGGRLEELPDGAVVLHPQQSSYSVKGATTNDQRKNGA